MDLSTGSKPKLGGCGTCANKYLIAGIVVLIVVLVGVLGARTWRAEYREGLSEPPFVDSNGYKTPVPGDPDRNILRRSEPYPPGRFPYGGLNSYYFSYDPAMYSSYEFDFCTHSPTACRGFAL